MILKRFKTDNLHLEYETRKTTKIVNESIKPTEKLTKLELLAHISKNWNDELGKEFESIRSLYSKTGEELELVNNKYIDIIEEEVINDNEIIINEQKLIDTVAELTMKYGDNEAVNEIRIDEGKIIFDILCETDIQQSVTNYNGIELHYNKVCSIPTNEEVETNEENDLDEDLLIQQSLFMNENYINYFENNSKEISVSDLKFSKWFKYLKKTSYSESFTIKFLADIKHFGVSINDAVFFLMHIFKSYKNEPTESQYKKEIANFLKKLKKS